MKSSWGGCNDFEEAYTFRMGPLGPASFPATGTIGSESTRIAGTFSRWMVLEASADAFGITRTRAMPAFRNCGYATRREGRGFYYTEHHGFYFRSDNSAGLGVRGVFGINVIPRTSPLEFFLELGLLVGLTPDFGSAGDVGIGMRFYP